MLIESKLKVKTDSGVDGAWGLPIEVMLAPDCPIIGGGGSGTVFSRPSFAVEVGGTSTLVAWLNLKAASPERAEQIALQGLTHVESGKTGDVVVTRGGKELIKFHVPLSEFTVAKAPSVKWDASKKMVKVAIELKWTNLSRAEKLVNFMLKCRFQPRELFVFDASGNRIRQSMVTAGLEAFKDAGTVKLAMAAEHFGDIVLDCSEGGLGAAAPGLGNLLQEFERVATKTVSIAHKVAPHWYAIYQGRFGGREDLQFLNDGATIVWTGEVIVGTMVLAVEYSPTCQAIGKTSMLLEVLQQVDSIYPELARYWWDSKEARRRRGLINGYFSMAESSLPQGMTTLPLMLGSAALPLDGEQTDKGLLVELWAYVKVLAGAHETATGARVNARGIVLKYGTFSQYVDLDALVKGGAYGQDDTGYSLAGELADLIRFACDPDNGENQTDKYEGFFRSLRKALASYLTESSSVMSKGSRACTMYQGKIHTADYIPEGEVWLHPDCPMAALFPDGSTALLVRTPVKTAAPARVRHTLEAVIGVFMVCAMYWHKANSGDADGDSVAAIPVPEEGEIVVQASNAAGMTKSTQVERFADEVWRRWFLKENQFLTQEGYVATYRK